MKALVLSDTHIKHAEQLADLRRLIEPFLDGVDVIIHAGDSASRVAVSFFEELKPTHIVAGNMDDRELAQSLPDKLIVNFGSYRIGVTHGWGMPSGIQERVLDYFSTSRVDAIVFGHSHQPFIGKRDGILLLNPGSPTDKRFADRNTIAILEADEELTARIIEL